MIPEREFQPQIDQSFLMRFSRQKNPVWALDSLSVVRSLKRMAGIFVLRRPREEGPNLSLNCRSEEHTSELQSLMRTSYAVFCLKKKKTINKYNTKTSKYSK